MWSMRCSTSSIAIADEVKRAFDVVVATGLLLLTGPLWVLAAIAVKLTSRGPVLYRASRVGQYGRPFTLLKFRTMSIDAAAKGPGITATRDPRVTGVGALLRRFKIDELPQLLNVLRGDMSLVGPRPEDPRYVSSYTPEQRLVLDVRPGITSPAAVAYRDEERLIEATDDVETVYLKQILPAKLTLDLDYVRRHSLWLDVVVIAKTIVGLVRRPRR